MEDDWYSGGGDAGGVVGAPGQTGDPNVGFQNGTVAGYGGGINYGDSFTPPAARAGVKKELQQPFGQGLPQMGYGVAGGMDDDEDYENEPPLLEELGINFEHIATKTLTVILPTKKIDISYLDDTDLAGPLVFCLCFGFCLLFTGKVHFGYIYGFGAFGCVAMATVLNLLGERPMDVWKTGSVLGYCLLPVIVLAVVNIVLDLRGLLGLGLGAVTVLWCTLAATRLFEEYLNMRHQRYLVAYPVGLLYCCFVLITIF